MVDRTKAAQPVQPDATAVRSRWDTSKPADAWVRGGGAAAAASNQAGDGKWGSGMEEEGGAPATVVQPEGQRRGGGRWGDEGPPGERKRQEDGELR